MDMSIGNANCLICGAHIVYAMELPERTACTFMANNAECRKRDCPFFPA